MTSPTWPDIPYPAWRDTAATLQLWTQVVGKVRLALTPWVNHGWQVPLYVTACGLGTGPMPVGPMPVGPGPAGPKGAGELVEIELDFVGHRLAVRSSSGAERALACARAAYPARGYCRRSGSSARSGHLGRLVVPNW